MTRPKRVGEPVQVYLTDRDRALLERVASRTTLPRSEVLRVALRRMAADLPGDAKSDRSLDFLIGSLDGARDVPPDLAANHDEYLYGSTPKRKRPPRQQPMRTR